MNLISVYEGMQDRFLTAGLDLPFIASIRKSYTLDENGDVQPLRYEELHTPFPPCTQRLVVFPLDSAPEVLQQAAAAANDILHSVLPPGTTVYINDPERLHITAFYLSHVDDPRPEPYRQDGGQGSGPSASTLHQEAQKLQATTGAFPAFHLQVEKLLLADSGTLLLCFSDPEGCMAAFRAHLRQGLPGAPTKQTSIVHSSLLRILTPQQLPPDARASIQQRCDSWTRNLQGMRVPCQNLWYIHEEYYANIAGPRSTVPLKL